MIPVSLRGTGSVLPGRVVSTVEVAARAIPPIEPAKIEQRAGIKSRSWVGPGTRAAPIAARVLRKALDAAGMAAEDLRRIIFVSSTGGDWLAPSTASRVAHELRLEGQCDCFDVNNGCMGFLTAFDLASRSIATGCGPIGVVGAWACSKCVYRHRHRSGSDRP